MEMPESYVYHGSPDQFDSHYANPKRNVRTTVHSDGRHEVMFDQESFHATVHKWIALAYTYTSKPYEINGKIAHYNVSVSLFENTKKVHILGFNSLEESLKQLYGDGGYLYHFNKNEFIYKEGLGPLEVIVETPTMPIKMEKIDNPIEEMQKLGVIFNFIDLVLPENERRRNYV